MGEIDLVVTYLDDSEDNWQLGFKYYQEKEIALGVQSESNRHAFGEERIRNWETFRYFLRGVEKNYLKILRMLWADYGVKTMLMP